MYKNFRKRNRQEINEFLRHNEAGINSSRPEVPKTKDLGFTISQYP